MKLSGLMPFLIILLMVQGCKKEDKKIPAVPEGSINLSELSNRHDYYLPFAVINDTSIISSAILNNETIVFAQGDFIEFKETGFYELILKYKDPQHANDTILFTTKTEERELSEWGIRAWIPAPFKTSRLSSEEVVMYYPRRYAGLINVPFIFYVRESGITKSIYCQGKCNSSGDKFNIKQGTGSVNVAASALSSKTDFVVGGKQLSASLTMTSEQPIVLEGTIDTPVDIPANSLVSITGNLNISSTGSLTVHEGVLILVDEALDINVDGPVIFSGTADNPVFVTCSRDNKFWGGFITRVAGGTIDAQYTIFCQSGYHDSDGYNWGHAGRQALFYTENSTLKLDHCFILDHIGQIFYPQYATLILDDILIQRAQTGGQLNYTNLTLHNSVLTDFPDDSYIFSDADNDALYLNASDAEIDNTIFMFAKDDGLDSGAGEGGDITVTNSRFEACFHEGAALSSISPAVKTHSFSGCVFTNCGQGLELGYSSPNHTVVADNCTFLNNGIGIRYGDNYDWSEVDGTMVVRNSVSLYNDKDIWNMVRMNWSPRTENLSFENTQVSKFCPQYPGLEIKPD
jgi:hypothetical protein